MVKSTKTSEEESGVKTKKTGENARKLVLLISMILIGILLIIYKSNYEYWSEQFVTFNQILFGVSLLLVILIVVAVLIDFKRIIRHELLGFIIFLIGAIILMLVPAKNFLGLESLAETSIMLYAVGGIIIAVGVLILMRTGGFLGVGFLGVIVNVVVSSNFALGDTEAVQYQANVWLLINFSIIFFILSFILLIYHDTKFFYLAKLIKEERESRKKKNYKMALSYCNKALRIYPYFAPALNNKGNVLINMGKKKDAIKCYKEALDINPDYLPAKKNLQLIKG